MSHEDENQDILSFLHDIGRELSNLLDWKDMPELCENFVVKNQSAVCKMCNVCGIENQSINRSLEGFSTEEKQEFGGYAYEPSHQYPTSSFDRDVEATSSRPVSLSAVGQMPRLDYVKEANQFTEFSPCDQQQIQLGGQYSPSRQAYLMNRLGDYDSPYQQQQRLYSRSTDQLSCMNNYHLAPQLQSGDPNQFNSLLDAAMLFNSSAQPTIDPTIINQTQSNCHNLNIPTDFVTRNSWTHPLDPRQQLQLQQAYYHIQSFAQLPQQIPSQSLSTNQQVDVTHYRPFEFYPVDANRLDTAHEPYIGPSSGITFDPSFHSRS